MDGIGAHDKVSTCSYNSLSETCLIPYSKTLRGLYVIHFNMNLTMSSRKLPNDPGYHSVSGITLEVCSCQVLSSYLTRACDTLWY